MRVTLPSVLDAFACGDADCACRRALRAATTAPAEVTAFPFRQAEAALVDGANRGTSTAAVDRFADYPLIAIGTPQGVELTIATLCPEVQRLLADNTEPLSVAGSDGGWRVPLRVFRPAQGGKLVRITPRRTVTWASFLQVRDQMLDFAIDPTLPLLARLARIGALADQVVNERSVEVQAAPLTSRAFLAFRGFVESRLADAPTEAMAAFAGRTLALHQTASQIDQARLVDCSRALAGDWRAHARAWLLPAERHLTTAAESWLGTRLHALPLDRDQSLARAWSELFEAFALGLRYAMAMGETCRADVTPAQLVASFALGEFLVATSGAALPAFELPRDVHERGPRMADLDMTLESVC
jgi:hypothetical protein